MAQSRSTCFTAALGRVGVEGASKSSLKRETNFTSLFNTAVFNAVFSFGALLLLSSRGGRVVGRRALRIEEAHPRASAQLEALGESHPEPSRNPEKCKRAQQKTTRSNEVRLLDCSAPRRPQTR